METEPDVYPALPPTSNPPIVLALIERLWNGGIRMSASQMQEYERDYIDLCVLLKKNKPHIEMARSMIEKMRDRYHGRGERAIAYMMVYQWYVQMDAGEALQMITRFTKVGCWKDMKYLCKYVASRTQSDCHPIITHCVQITIDRLMEDYLLYVQNPETHTQISNVAKWIPRENSAYHWVYEKMWKEWMLRNYPYLLSTKKGETKGRQIYRKWLSSLNAYLGTKEINETKQEWEKIAASKLTYMNLWKASLTKDYDQDQCRANTQDQAQCRDHKAIQGEKKNAYHTNARFRILTATPANNTVPLEEYVKKGCEILDEEECDTLRISLINHLWKNLVSTGVKLEAVIPILSIEIDYDEEYTSQLNHGICGAIGVACMIAQKSKIQNRILCVRSDGTLTLLNLTGYPKFLDMLRAVREHILSDKRSDCSRSIEEALHRIRDIMVATNTPNVLTVIVSNHDLRIREQTQPIVYWNTSCISNKHNRMSNNTQMVYLTGTNAKDLAMLSRITATIENGSTTNTEQTLGFL